MNAICLAIDRLSVGYFGAYGNTWIDTPALDRLACQSIVFDQAWSESPRLQEFYRGLWQGIHPLSRSGKTGDKGEDCSISLPARLAKAGVKTTLLTDEWAMAEDPLADCFDELVEIRPRLSSAASTGVNSASDTVADVEQTQTAERFARIIDWLDGTDGQFMLWCHLSSLGAAWDAPYDFRLRYAEEGDPQPPADTIPPQFILEDDYDPDMLLGITQAYAGQVTLLDTCIAALMQYMDESGIADDTLLAFVAPRGYPLGEHCRVGPCDEALYGELLHVPMMVRFPDRLAAAARSQALVTPADLAPTLLDCWGLPPGDQFCTARSLMPVMRGERPSVRDRICAAGFSDGRAIRVPAWYLRMEDGDALFAKPFDRWECNDVADRCHTVVVALHEAADEFQRYLDTGEPTELSPLDDVLIDGLE